MAQRLKKELQLLDVYVISTGAMISSGFFLLPGIAAAQEALASNGVLAYWSAGPDQAFHDRLRRCGFLVEEVTVYAHGNKGVRHTIWLVSLS